MWFWEGGVQSSHSLGNGLLGQQGPVAGVRRTRGHGLRAATTSKAEADTAVQEALLSEANA